MARLPRGVVPEVPGPGQESVWDYPRPPRVEAVADEVEVWFAGQRVASSTDTVRVLETSHPPTYYLPVDAFRAGVLRPTEGSSVCEWKGRARYLDLVADAVVVRAAAWTYPAPAPGFEILAGCVSLYPAAVDRCLVGGEVVGPQPGGFYGGWITPWVVGPFKGGPGTLGW